MIELNWKIGFEIELLAPKGASRRDLAQAIAKKANGHSERCFYPQSEPSSVPGTPVFENLILGFDAYDNCNQLMARCVDDLTINQDLNRHAPSLSGWYRILSDDIRFLRLIMAQCDPDTDRKKVLEPVAKLFNTKLTFEDDIVRLADTMSTPIALAASLPGERERPCEVITPPFESNHYEKLDNLLDTAQELGFTVPHEAAVHIHYDAKKLMNTQVFCQLVQVLVNYGNQLKQLLKTNNNCVRLGNIPEWLIKQCHQPAFQQLDWPLACEQLQGKKLTKYCDFNLTNLIYDNPEKLTFEVRILPGSINSHQIIQQAKLFEAILNWCIESSNDKKLHQKLEHFIDDLPLHSDSKSLWLSAL